MRDGKLVKLIIFAALPIAASYFFGTICAQIDQQIDLFFSPSIETLYLILWLLLALGVVAIAAGLAATLLRPLWICFISFAISALAMLLAWEISKVSGVLMLVYFVAGLIYARGVANGLSERLNFSVRPISENQTTLLMVLTIVACASFYFGCAAQIEEAGFSIPSFASDMVFEIAQRQIEGNLDLSSADKKAFLDEFREQFEQQVESTIEPYEEFIPIGMAVILFTFLVTIVRLLSWIPTLVLRIVLRILTALRVTRVITEAQEARRLTIG